MDLTAHHAHAVHLPLPFPVALLIGGLGAPAFTTEILNEENELRNIPILPRTRKRASGMYQPSRPRLNRPAVVKRKMGISTIGIPIFHSLFRVTRDKHNHHNDDNNKSGSGSLYRVIALCCDIVGVVRLDVCRLLIGHLTHLLSKSALTHPSSDWTQYCPCYSAFHSGYYTSPPWGVRILSHECPFEMFALIERCCDP